MASDALSPSICRDGRERLLATDELADRSRPNASCAGPPPELFHRPAAWSPSRISVPRLLQTSWHSAPSVAGSSRSARQSSRPSGSERCGPCRSQGRSCGAIVMDGRRGAAKPALLEVDQTVVDSASKAKRPSETVPSRKRAPPASVVSGAVRSMPSDVCSYPKKPNTCIAASGTCRARVRSPLRGRRLVARPRRVGERDAGGCVESRARSRVEPGPFGGFCGRAAAWRVRAGSLAAVDAARLQVPGAAGRRSRRGGTRSRAGPCHPP